MGRVAPSSGTFSALVLAPMVVGSWLSPLPVDAETAPEIFDVSHGSVVIHDGDTINRSQLTDTSPYWTFDFNWPHSVPYPHGVLAVFRGSFGHIDGAPVYAVNYGSVSQGFPAGEASLSANLQMPGLGDVSTPSGTYTAIAAEVSDYQGFVDWFSSGGSGGVAPSNSASLVFTYDATNHSQDLGAVINSLTYRGVSIHSGGDIYRDDLPPLDTSPNDLDHYWSADFTWPNSVPNTRAILMLFRGTFGNLEGGTPVQGQNFGLSEQGWGTINNFGKYFNLPPLKDSSITPSDYTMMLVERDPKYVPDPNETVPQEALWFSSGGTQGTPPLKYATLTFHFKGDKITCCSSVLFIPGTESSRLYYRDQNGAEHQLWEPYKASDVPQLALRSDGTSVLSIYTKPDGIIDSAYSGIGLPAHLGPLDLEVYRGFEDFMNSLVASTTLHIKEWRAYPYDWRYDVSDIVENGTLTEEPDGSMQQVYLENMLAAMAATSTTGKVTIVAHSNGGLIAKALLAKLKTEGKDNLVEQLIMVGTPQWGTPVDIGSMLHGDGQNLGFGLITYAPSVRATAVNLPGPYDLLPSPVYFSHVANAVVSFYDDSLTGPFVLKFPSGIGSFPNLVSFITDAFGLDASTGSTGSLNTPLALRSDLVQKAAATHATIDTWAPPASLKITSIAGWGQLTTYSYAYDAEPGHTICAVLPTGSGCSRDTEFVHTPLNTEDGDGTVVSPSAIGDVGDGWYFDIQAFRDDKKGNFSHQNLTNASPVENFLLNLIMGKQTQEDYIIKTKPPATSSPLLFLGGMSPINILVTDSHGNETGIVPIDESSGLYIAKNDIPGSTVNTSGEEKFVYVPQGETYSVTANGYATGPANIEIKMLDSNGAVTASSTLVDIPVTASTTIALSVNVEGSASSARVDLDGDGVTDAVVSIQEGTTTPFDSSMAPLQYIAYFQKTVATLGLSKASQQSVLGFLKNLTALIKNYESKREKPPIYNKKHPEFSTLFLKELELQFKFNVRLELNLFANYIKRQERISVQGPRFSTMRDGIPPEEGEQILAMINELAVLLKIK